MIGFRYSRSLVSATSAFKCFLRTIDVHCDAFVLYEKENLIVRPVDIFYEQGQCLFILVLKYSVFKALNLNNTT